MGLGGDGFGLDGRLPTSTTSDDGSKGGFFGLWMVINGDYFLAAVPAYGVGAAGGVRVPVFFPLGTGNVQGW